MSAGALTRSAVISPCGTWRYTLEREWDPLYGLAVFVLLNPSIANAEVDDPTVRRGVAFAKGWGFGRLCFVNLYAYRATNPKMLALAHDPVGPENDEWIARRVATADLVVPAWGGFADRRLDVARRQARVTAILRESARCPVRCLGTTRAGRPRHPLYLRRDETLVDFEA